MRRFVSPGPSCRRLSQAPGQWFGALGVSSDSWQRKSHGMHHGTIRTPVARCDRNVAAAIQRKATRRRQGAGDVIWGVVVVGCESGRTGVRRLACTESKQRPLLDDTAHCFTIGHCGRTKAGRTPKAGVGRPEARPGVLQKPRDDAKRASGRSTGTPVPSLCASGGGLVGPMPRVAGTRRRPSASPSRGSAG